MNRRIGVLIIDDSAMVRQTLKEILSSDSTIEVIGTAADPYIAAQRIQQTVPDVITLDLEMPRMDGLTFLRKMMHQLPIPVVVCSAHTATSSSGWRALAYGAVEIIAKPRTGTRQFLEESKVLICDAVRAAFLAGPKRPIAASLRPAPKLSADAVLAKAVGRTAAPATDSVVVLGASTGGTEAIQTIVENLPPDAPAFVVVQHMPEHFTDAFAKRLDKTCRVSVREATNLEPVRRGSVLIAPGNQHLLLKRARDGYVVEVRDGPLVRRHRPSVDVLFRSAALHAGRNAIGVLLTGMGDDGATGMCELRDAGAATIAQDEASSVVFGMPAEAIRRGGAEKVVPLSSISEEILRIGASRAGAAASSVRSAGKQVVP